jgi:selenium metabolism protein YedF
VTNTVDARGLPCPQPVILTRSALRESTAVTTIVDNESVRRNVTRMAERAGCTVQAEERDDGIYLYIAGRSAPLEDAVSQSAGVPAGHLLVLVVRGECMGRGDDELGHILMRSFFHTLGEAAPLPDTIIFYNSAVKLVSEGSPVLENLRELCARGVEILACGTCLGHYELRESVAVGETSNMYTIAETMLRAGRVISL